MKKRFLNLLLVLIMMICVLPFAASADTTCDHDYSILVSTVKKPTCTENGRGWYECSICHNRQRGDIPAAHDFSVEVEVVSEPTCTERGVVRFKCKNCEETEKRNELPAKGHTEVEIPAKAATCTTRAKTAGTKCSVCDEVLVAQKNTGKALGHTFTELVERKEPTCTVDGQEVYKCVRCDETETKVLEKLGHDITADPATLKEITTNPSCKNTGKGKYGCTRCNAWSILDVPVVACEAKEVPAVEATCEGTGLTAGTKCRFCGKVMKAQEEVAALGHDYKFNRVTRTATCKVKGQEQHICTLCGDVKYVATPLAECTPVVTAGVPATCTESGLKDGTKCSVCEKILLSREDIPALGHDYQFKRITRNATCTENGQEQHECTRCGDKIYKKIVASGHNYEFARYSVGNEPTCTEGGVERYQCTICKEMGPDKVVGPLGHAEVELERWEPTCTKDGIKETKCSRCNLLVRERINALGHTETAVTGTPATCTATGLTDGVKCSVCQATITAQEEIPMLDHTWKVIPAVEKTCTTDGNNEYKECEVCKATLNKEVYPAGHVFENYKCTVCDARDSSCEHENADITVINSTCTTAGTKKFNCPDCGDKYEEPLPLAEHQRKDVSVAATCTTKGKTHIVCAICNADIVGPTEIPTIDHTNVNGSCSSCGAVVCDHSQTTRVTRDSTCTTRGTVTVTCNSCGYVSVSELSLAAHNHVNGVCTVCGHKDTNRVTYDCQDVFLTGDAQG